MGKKSKKHKKEKKSKKKQSKRHKRHSSSSETSDSEEEVWVEKKSSPQTVQANTTNARDDWMMVDHAFLGTTTKEKRDKKKDENKNNERNILEQAGQSSRELNPYWKNGGTGLPCEETEAASRYKLVGVGDHGAHWLRKAYQRAQEQAEEEGRSLEEVVAHRWGSLEKFKEVLREAEEKQSANTRGYEHRKSDYSSSRTIASERRRDDRHFRNNERREKLTFKKPEEDDYFNNKVSRGYSQSQSSSSSRKNWRKPQYADEKMSDDKLRSADSRHQNSSPECDREKRTSKQQVSMENTKKAIDDPKQVMALVRECASEERIMTDDEMNNLAAQMMKAEILGDMKRANELKLQLEKAQALKKSQPNKARGVSGGGKDAEVVLLTETDNRGFSRPVEAGGSLGHGRGKKRRSETHEGQKRIRYFPDDDKHSLQDLFVKEKYNSVEDQNSTFLKLMAKQTSKSGNTLDEDDAFEETAAMDDGGREERKSRESAIRAHQARERALDSCRWCLGSQNNVKEAIVHCQNKIYVSVPTYQSLAEGHCLIVPNFHVPCATLLDEDIWEEIMDVRKKIVRIFESQDEDVVFFENASYLHKHPHMVLQCVPVPKDVGDTAPIFFKKAILECETEWTNNKKVVELAGRDVRKAVPKGLPYFAVDFGMQSGYAHVIEDLKMFPSNFAQAIIGGMLDLDHTIWRKPRPDTAENIKKKTEALKKLFEES